jgi:hypothetical protein
MLWYNSLVCQRIHFDIFYPAFLDCRLNGLFSAATFQRWRAWFLDDRRMTDSGYLLWCRVGRTSVVVTVPAVYHDIPGANVERVRSLSAGTELR